MDSVERRLNAFFEHNNNLTPVLPIQQGKTHEMQ